MGRARIENILKRGGGGGHPCKARKAFFGAYQIKIW